MKAHELEQFLQAQIPIASALGAHVVQLSDELAEISAPLGLNRNHMGTAFGGSLNAILVLSCYAWLFNVLNSRKLPVHVIIKDSRIKYLKPVKAEFSAICRAPSDEELQRFLKTLEKKQQAQINLQASIAIGGVVACQFAGEFVAR